MTSRSNLLKFTAALTLIVLGLGFAILPVAAQVPGPSDNDVNKIASQLFCPVCENTPLDVCPTQACAQWRELIRTKLGEGWDETKIKAYFVEQYGARVLSEPPMEGLNWLVYIIPPALMLVGVYILTKAFITMRNNSKRSVALAEENTDHHEEDEYLKKIEDEINKRN
jgi:cytochrome c-type biogenesis protein CcmH